MKAVSEYNGILLMHKPQGFTSHDVVAKLRGIFNTRRIGHGGTLDPMATGVLPIFVGGATKAADFAAAQDKEYIAGFTLGFCTDTQDTTGRKLEASDVRVSKAAVCAALDGFHGAQQQLVPMYSAVKVNGQKLYDLARKGKAVERPSREIFIRAIALLDFDEEAQTGTFRVTASKGTYVRTIVHDLGLRLGTFAAMHSLVRTRAGAYPLTDTVHFAAVEQAREAGGLQALLRPADSLFMHHPALSLTAEGAERAARGAVIFPRHTDGLPQQEGTLVRVYADEAFLMLGQIRTLDIGGYGLFVYKNFR